MTRIASIAASLLAALAGTVVAGVLACADPAAAAEVKVMNSGGFAAAYRELAPRFEQASKDSLSVVWGPSMGDTPQAIPNRLRRGEPADVVIMVDTALEALVKDGKVMPGSRIDLARSKIGMAVRQGTAKPDIGSVDAFRRALLAAKSIAYSDSASGVYLSTVLFARLGIADAVRTKSRMIPAEPVGAVVARGEAEIGFQQVSELLPVPGIELVGTLPDELQNVTIFSAGIAAGAPEPQAAKALLDFLASPEAAPVIRKSGLEPVNR